MPLFVIELTTSDGEEVELHVEGTTAQLVRMIVERKYGGWVTAMVDLDEVDDAFALFDGPVWRTVMDD